MEILNEEAIKTHGNKKGRKDTLKVIKSAVESVNSYKATKKKVKIENKILKIEDIEYNLEEIRNIYVIGAGKATYSIAKALNEILGNKITEGHIIIKDRENSLNNISVTTGGHPIPSKNSLKNTREIKKIAKKAKGNDLVICTITGGASALMTSPDSKIELNHIKKINKLLLNSGAPIEDINTVRKHLSDIKGGKLAELIQPAKIANLIVIDEIAGDPWGPTVPDHTTFEDAINVLKKHNLWKKTPKIVKEHLKNEKSNNSLETPNENNFKDYNINNVILSDINIACESAKKKSKELGYNTMLLTSKLKGESREAGIFLASIAKEIKEKGNPLKPPSILILGGETTVKIKSSDHGEGGPSQEFSLGAALEISGDRDIIISSIDTDGTDGPTDIAGGIVDGYTLERAESKGLDIYNALKTHDSKNILENLDDVFITNSTGTNVMNLYFAVIL